MLESKSLLSFANVYTVTTIFDAYIYLFEYHLCTIMGGDCIFPHDVLQAYVYQGVSLLLNGGLQNLHQLFDVLPQIAQDQ